MKKTFYGVFRDPGVYYAVYDLVGIFSNIKDARFAKNYIKEKFKEKDEDVVIMKIKLGTIYDDYIDEAEYVKDKSNVEQKTKK